jgi:hypothetical protein
MIHSRSLAVRPPKEQRAKRRFAESAVAKMSQRGAIFFTPYPQLVAESATQIPLEAIRRQWGTFMSLDAVDYAVSQSDERTSEDASKSLMTPARRAALDALEREFQDLLQSLPRAAA